MPFYDFKCMNCKYEFDEIVKVDQKDVPCPKCKSLNTKKFLISKEPGTAPTFKFIGKGFYETDYKNKK
jgi:putative FmdB family regulatory protein